jgi:hypothetical protein
MAGPVTVTAQGSSSTDSASSSFTVLAPPTVSLTPSSGVPASTFNAQLSNFAAAESVEIFFAGNDTGDGCVTDSTGACTVSSVQVPTNLAGGVYTVAADSTSDSAFASFTITPTIALSPSSGTPGSTFNVNGAGFLPDETVSILFGGQATSASCATGTTGTCSVANVQVPATAMAGPVTVTAQGSSSTDSASASFTVLAPPTVSLTPSSGVPASTFNAQLSNFAAAESVEIFFAGNDTGDGCVTDSTGACTVSSVQVPTNLAGGVYTVAADSTSDSAFASFTITPTIALSPSSGTPGSTFNVNGAGFLPDETVSILFGGQATSASCATGTTGTCSVANVQVPATAMAGPVTVTAQGSSSTDSASSSFTVLAP